MSVDATELSTIKAKQNGHTVVGNCSRKTHKRRLIKQAYLYSSIKTLIKNQS